MANLRDIAPALRTIQKQLITDIDELSDRLERGDITIDEWERLMGEVVARGTAAAFEGGKGGRVEGPEVRVINRFISEQLIFLANFANDIKNTGWLEKYKSRAQMYATATSTPFSLGDVVKQAGKILPLPSMPAEGTICHTNCGCRWEIVVIDKEGGGF